MTLQLFLRESRGRYFERAKRLAFVTRYVLTAREVAAFVICTPRQTYECALRQWRTWRTTGCVEGAFAPTRRAILERIPLDGSGIRRYLGESGPAWIARLRTIPGLGLIKAPFLACLLEPRAADVPVCLDVWMARGLGLALDGRDLSFEDWKAGQRMIAGRARKMKMKPFLYQWAMWDYVRTAGANTQALFVNETDIAADLTREGRG